MNRKLIEYSFAFGLLAPSLLAGIHYGSHAYLKFENSLKEEITSKIEKLTTAYNAFRGTTLNPSPQLLTVKELIERESLKHNLPPELIESLIDIESNWKSDAERFEPQLNTRSIGLMQPLATWAGKYPCQNITWTKLYNEEENIKCGTAILAMELKNKRTIFEGLISYNGGASCNSRPLCREKASSYAGKVIMTFADRMLKREAVLKN